MRLQEFEGWPAGLLDCAAHELWAHLDGPAIVHLPGARAPALFVSVLLHGNETGGWEALRLLQRRFEGGVLPRSMIVLIGNVEAARFRLRRLDHQPDYNRIWCGGGRGGQQGVEGPEADLAREIVARIGAHELFCSVDVHNNTGVNPHYACVTAEDATSLALAARFARPVILVHQPATVLARAFAPFAPAIILEAGRPGEQRGVEHVAAYLEGLLRLETLPGAPATAVDLYRTVASVKLREDVRFGFAGVEGPREGLDLHLLAEFEHFNFEELDADTLFAHVPEGAALPFTVTDDDGRDVADDWFRRRGDEVRFARRVVPAMFSPDVRILRQDVVCYLMERLS
ncbi:MAG: succinylglutamate desuccinylase/aspartoacylase family protein [Pseudomonadales bacterium]|jgi:succinylglutamate desuccinylase|nr:succinylglutamate desuccinylase/aspartoacylase family protein [Pseudomonadales bacterium]